MDSLMIIGAFSIVAVFRRLGGAVAASGRRRLLQGGELFQKVRKKILVTGPKASAPPARRFRAIYDIPLGGGLMTPPYPYEGIIGIMMS